MIGIIDEGCLAAVHPDPASQQKAHPQVWTCISVVRTGPLMNTNSQLAEDKGADTAEQLDKYESVPRG